MLCPYNRVNWFCCRRCITNFGLCIIESILHIEETVYCTSSSTALFQLAIYYFFRQYLCYFKNWGNTWKFVSREMFCFDVFSELIINKTVAIWEDYLLTFRTNRRTLVLFIMISYAVYEFFIEKLFKCSSFILAGFSVTTFKPLSIFSFALKCVVLSSDNRILLLSYTGILSASFNFFVESV